MNCREFKDNISLYIDEELDNIDSKEFELHLLKCDDCREEYESMIKILKMLNDSEEEELPEDFKSNLRRGLEEAKSETKNRKINWKILSSIAASIIVFFVSYGLINNTNILEEKVEESRDEAQNYNMSDISEKAKLAPKDNYGIVAEEPKKEFDKVEINEDEVNNSNTISLTGVDNRLNKDYRGDISNHIISRDGFINIKVYKSEKTLDDILSYVKDNDGLIIDLSSRDIMGNENDKELKNTNLSVMIHKEHFYNTMEYIEDLGDVESKDVRSIDPEYELTNINNTVKNLRLQENRLNNLIEKTEDINEKIRIENELSLVRTQIDNLEVKLEKYKSGELQSIIRINIREIKKESILTRIKRWISNR